jgi:cell division protein FtsQ
VSTRRPPSADADLQGGKTEAPGGNEGVRGSRSQSPAAAAGWGSGKAARARAVRRHADPRRTAFFGVLVLAVLAGAAWALLGSSLLVVRHVEVIGNRLVTAAQVRQAAKIKPGTPLATLDTAAVARRVEQLAPVLSAAVSRSWLDTIVITVRERTPVLAVAVAGGYELVDPYGVVVRSAARKPAGMPLLSPVPAVLRGNAAIRAAAIVLRHLPAEVRTRLRWVSAASASAVTLHLAGRVTVLWGGTGQAAQKTAELGLLLRTHARYYDISDPTTAVTQG